MKIRSYFCELAMPLAFSWLFMTFLVDFVAIPAVFRNSTNIVDAGKIGMKVFSQFNMFEVLLSFGMIIGLWMSQKIKFRKIYIFLSISLFTLALFYCFYLTPSIIDLNLKMQIVEKMSAEFSALQTKHQIFHNQYRILDSLKIMALLALSLILLFNKVESSRETL